MLNNNMNYPINSPTYIKVSRKLSFKIADRIEPWVYLKEPKCHFFEFTEPISEMMVVYLAGFIVPLFGWRTLMVREEFPDALFEDINTGEQIKVEFESYSINFLNHNHSPSECDYIICWQDNMSTEAKARYLFNLNPDLKLLELKKIFHHYDFSVTIGTCSGASD